MRKRSLAVAGLCLAAASAQAAGPSRRLAAVTIQPLDSDLPPIEAMYNPKEVSVDRSVPWRDDTEREEDPPSPQFVGHDPRRLNVVLEFADLSDVRKLVAPVEALTLADPKTRRPPRVKLVWGSPFGGFEGVVESVGVKYTVFFPNGNPARARVNVRVREAKTASPPPCGTDLDCPEGQVCVNQTCKAP
jgi:hypothetical protein